MSIISLNDKNFDVVTLQMHPKRMFSSSSNGITGSIFVYAERSPSIRLQEAPTVSGSDASGSFDSFSDASLEEFRISVWGAAAEPAEEYTGGFYDPYEQYLTEVNQTVKSPELKKYVEILRFQPTNTFTSDNVRKSVVLNNLFPYYKKRAPNNDFSYTNYHCLNFFTASSVSPNKALIYPSPSLRADPRHNQYNITSSFNISFYINPRYSCEIGQDFKAGTIMHMSSCYAVSLHTGSLRDRNGKPSGFRLSLQLSSSADIAPSEIDLSKDNNSRTYPRDLIFLSEDNSLKRNHWHHVSINWDKNINDGTGSFTVDAKSEQGSLWSLPSASFNESFGSSFNPLFVGNYYNGNNAGFNTLVRFFNSNAATNEGVEDWGGGGAITEDPPAELLDHPLNAEIHDIRIYSRTLTDNEITTASIEGPNTSYIRKKVLKFYLAPFFTKNSTSRKVLQTPFQTSTEFTETPFNTTLSWDVDGKDINLQNFVRESRFHTFPRLFHLTSSEISDTTKDWQTANRLLYEFGTQGSYVRGRNLLVLPCDNGYFVPNFELMKTSSDRFWPEHLEKPRSGSAYDFMKNDLGMFDPRIITLRDLVAMPTYMTGLTQDESSAYVITLTESGGSVSDDLQILQQTRDTSSDEIVFFDASNLFYGRQIKPNTYELLDKNLTGSDGKVSMRIKDDGRGNLYRCDSSTPVATWNSVGNVLYDEGISVIKSPNIPFFGKDQFEIKFEGHHHVHTLEINVNANVGRINSSSNSSFKPMRPDDYANSIDDNFVAISEILFHDDNLNIVARANLAQPVVKRLTDKYLFRVKLDF